MKRAFFEPPQTASWDCILDKLPGLTRELIKALKQEKAAFLKQGRGRLEPLNSAQALALIHWMTCGQSNCMALRPVLRPTWEDGKWISR